MLTSSKMLMKVSSKVTTTRDKLCVRVCVEGGKRERGKRPIISQSSTSHHHHIYKNIFFMSFLFISLPINLCFSEFFLVDPFFLPSKFPIFAAIIFLYIMCDLYRLSYGREKRLIFNEFFFHFVDCRSKNQSQNKTKVNFAKSNTKN